MRYEDLIAQSTKDPEAFWLAAAQGIDWDRAPTQACDFSDAPVAKVVPRWGDEYMLQCPRPPCGGGAR